MQLGIGCRQLHLARPSRCPCLKFSFDRESCRVLVLWAANPCLGAALRISQGDVMAIYGLGLPRWFSSPFQQKLSSDYLYVRYYSSPKIYGNNAISLSNIRLHYDTFDRVLYFYRFQKFTIFCHYFSPNLTFSQIHQQTIVCH